MAPPLDLGVELAATQCGTLSRSLHPLVVSSRPTQRTTSDHLPAIWNRFMAEFLLNNVCDVIEQVQGTPSKDMIDILDALQGSSLHRKFECIWTSPLSSIAAAGLLSASL